MPTYQGLHARHAHPLPPSSPPSPSPFIPLSPPPPPRRLSRVPEAGAVHKFGALLETLLSCRVLAAAEPAASRHDLVVTTAEKCPRSSPRAVSPRPVDDAAAPTAPTAGTPLRMEHKRLRKPWVWETVVRGVQALAEGAGGRCSCKSLC